MTKTDRRVQRTRELLQKALIELMNERGYDAITIQDIVDRANVARTTFYVHYTNKDDLFMSCHETIVSEFQSGLIRPHPLSREELLSPEVVPGMTAACAVWRMGTCTGRSGPRTYNNSARDGNGSQSASGLCRSRERYLIRPAGELSGGRANRADAVVVGETQNLLTRRPGAGVSADAARHPAGCARLTLSLPRHIFYPVSPVRPSTKPTVSCSACRPARTFDFEHHIPAFNLREARRFHQCGQILNADHSSDAGLIRLIA